MRKVVLVAATTALVLPLVVQQTSTQALSGQPTIAAQRRAGPQTGPIPRLPDGTVDLGDGVWTGGGPINDIEQEGGLKKGEVESLLLPWAKALMATRDVTQEPHNRCLPMGIPRVTPFPYRFVQNYTHRKPTHMFILHEGNIHSYRQIFMDGRKHPPEVDPTWYGHSIGWYEKDTLVIDTVGYNDKSWFDRRGFPHTEQMHTIERWTRLDKGRMEHRFTLDDPGAYTRPWTVMFMATLSPPGDDLMEYICTENNQYGVSTIPGWADKFAKP